MTVLSERAADPHSIRQNRHTVSEQEHIDHLEAAQRYAVDACGFGMAGKLEAANTSALLGLLNALIDIAASLRVLAEAHKPESKPERVYLWRKDKPQEPDICAKLGLECRFCDLRTTCPQAKV